MHATHVRNKCLQNNNVPYIPIAKARGLRHILVKNGINGRILRLSVGIEGISDLICEFNRVFATASIEVLTTEKSVDDTFKLIT